MPIDPRLAALGYTTVARTTSIGKHHIFISGEGLTSTGKTHFLRTCPPPQVCIDLNRGMTGVAEYDLWGNEIVRKTIRVPDLDIGGVLPTPAELQIARAGYTEFKTLMHRTFEALAQIGGGTLSIDTAGPAYSMAQIARFGQLGKIGEVPPGSWDPMKAEFERIFLEYEDYPVNLIVMQHQGSKFNGAAGETDVKGYKPMIDVAQIHLEFQRVYRRKDNGMIIKNSAGIEQFDLVRRVKKCRQRLSLMGTEFPVIFLDEAGQMSSTPTEQSIGGDFETIALACFPNSSREDWF